MSTAWVAAAVRSRAMSQRRIGAATSRSLAGQPTLELAAELLADTPYGHDVRPGQDLAGAQHAVAAAVLWNLRVLAGWLPRGSAQLMRVLAGGFEVANVDERLREVQGATAEPYFQLGSLSTAWTRLAHVGSVAELRDLLAASAWGDPGGDTIGAVRLGMRLSWAARVASSVPEARVWACGAAALLVARDVLVGPTEGSTQMWRIARPLLGTGARAGSLAALTQALPAEARWPIEGIDDPAELWRAEARWWRRVGSDGAALLRRPTNSCAPVVGAVAVLGADAWRVRGALEVAARGGSSEPTLMEVFDALG